METPFPPFDPDGDEDIKEQVSDTPVRLRDIPLRAIFPNLLTLLAICSGLTSIRFAIDERIELAVAAIIFAGFLDGIDGRVARFLKSTSRFGAEMDSLADFVNFGVAPAMLLYFTLLHEGHSMGWIASLIYAICACLRLARFNVMLDNPNLPEWRAGFFTGVPAPAGAIIGLLPIYLLLLEIEVPIFVVIIYTMVCGFFMVSNIPSFSGKDFAKLRRDMVMPFMIFAVILAAAVISYPWIMFSLLAIGYLASLPFSHIKYKKLLAADKPEKD